MSSSLIRPSSMPKGKRQCTEDIHNTATLKDEAVYSVALICFQGLLCAGGGKLCMRTWVDLSDGCCSLKDQQQEEVHYGPAITPIHMLHL